MRTLLFLLFPFMVMAQPSVIPFPQIYKEQKGTINMSNLKGIECGASVQKEASILQKQFPHLKIGKGIKLEVGKVVTPLYSNEGYELIVQKNNVRIKANTSHGIFNGIQTLLQLIDKNGNAPICYIKDWPAFSWRGHMIDVGRNYMSMDRLKEMIDVMARYKLNVFHFHPTEDIAWRIAIKKYPQLTDGSTMIRNKGKFYTEAEIKELIQYCKDRHIQFIPEIDMPGHSAAFKRAMNTDMQSDTGLAIVKEILKEFCETYDVPYIHIGADEVKITNENFIPEVSKLLEGYGKQIIGWQPGGNFTPNTIRQLWMENNGERELIKTYRTIDSRHLYLNHMDPEEAVVTIFNRQIAGVTYGDSMLLGGIICTWHDRNVRSEDDILMMSPIYPGIVTFGERSWRGGGQKGWIANISDGDSSSFFEFENRLLWHKQTYFKTMPFPYYKQAHLTWTLEVPNLKVPSSEVVGGTIILRHWWDPLIKGAIKNAKENTTAYATTKIWSDQDTLLSCRIGFFDISRSQATDSPPIGAWDNKGSMIWVNEKEITPPVWKRGNLKGNLEIPLEDEGYAYRPPTLVQFKKGWNIVKIKAPIGTFKGPNWNNPVKWMFTFIPE